VQWLLPLRQGYVQANQKEIAGNNQGKSTMIWADAPRFDRMTQHLLTS